MFPTKMGSKEIQMYEIYWRKIREMSSEHLKKEINSYEQYIKENSSKLSWIIFGKKPPIWNPKEIRKESNYENFSMELNRRENLERTIRKINLLYDEYITHEDTRIKERLIFNYGTTTGLEEVIKHYEKFEENK